MNVYNRYLAALPGNPNNASRLSNGTSQALPVSLAFEHRTWSQSYEPDTSSSLLYCSNINPDFRDRTIDQSLGLAI